MIHKINGETEKQRLLKNIDKIVQNSPVHKKLSITSVKLAVIINVNVLYRRLACIKSSGSLMIVIF